MKFIDLGVITPIRQALYEKEYESATAIQNQAIPQILKRKDVLACAQTGTGKTAAFAIPIIQLIHQIERRTDRGPCLRSLIITPTRELAIQIDENIRAYSKHTCVKHAVIFGGVKQHQQVTQIKKGLHLLVATPGRLLDLIQQGIIDLSTIKIFVLDEADRMLDMGFITDIRKLLKILPSQRQSLFFSATMPENIVQLSKKILVDPIKIEVAPVSSAAPTIQQFVYYTNKKDKKDLLLTILEDRKIEQTLIFTRTKHGADRIARLLKKNGISAQAIHGDKAQNQRQKVLQQFKSGRLRALVATDIAARGIDIIQLQYVINYEVPDVAETYVHRIGRSGRAGEEGTAISLCEPEENQYIRDVQHLIGEELQVIRNHAFPQTDQPMSREEKKKWLKEKQKRKQEFFANRNKKRPRSMPSRSGR